MRVRLKGNLAGRRGESPKSLWSFAEEFLTSGCLNHQRILQEHRNPSTNLGWSHDRLFQIREPSKLWNGMDVWEFLLDAAGSLAERGRSSLVIRHVTFICCAVFDEWRLDQIPAFIHLVLQHSSHFLPLSSLSIIKSINKPNSRHGSTSLSNEASFAMLWLLQLVNVPHIVMGSSIDA